MDHICEAFVVLAEWAGTQGAIDLAQKLGLWEGRLGEFNVAINAHREPLSSSDGLTVPPMHIAVNAPDYLGAVMLIAPDGGIGSAGMEGDVIALAKAEIAKAEAV